MSENTSLNFFSNYLSVRRKCMYKYIVTYFKKVRASSYWMPGRQLQALLFCFLSARVSRGCSPSKLDPSISITSQA